MKSIKTTTHPILDANKKKSCFFLFFRIPSTVKLSSLVAIRKEKEKTQRWLVCWGERERERKEAVGNKTHDEQLFAKEEEEAGRQRRRFGRRRWRWIETKKQTPRESDEETHESTEKIDPKKAVVIIIILLSKRSDKYPIGHWNNAPEIVIRDKYKEISKIEKFIKAP